MKFFSEKSSYAKNLLNETFVGGVMLVFLKKYDFECRDMYSVILAVSEHQDSERKKVDSLSVLKSFRCRRLLIKNLTEEIKPKDSTNYEVENPKTSKLEANFAVLHYLEYDRGKKSKNFPLKSPLHLTKCRVVPCC